MSKSDSAEQALRRSLLLLATTAGVAVANVYYNQPLLNSFQQSFPHHAAWIGAVPTATQIGFAIGLLMLSPLGDRMDRRRLILFHIVGVCFALAVAATAWTLPMLIGASFLIGLFASVTQQAAPFATDLAPPERRGHAVGTVMGGLLLGILLARTVAGFVGGYLGWRTVFFVAIIAMLILFVLLNKYLPSSRPASTLGYGQLLKSLGHLIIELRGLREAALSGACMFAAFSIFWSVLALLLAQKPFYAGPQAAGLFGIIGAVAVLIAPWAGKFTDRRGARTTISVAIILVALSFVILGISRSSIVGLVIGVIVLDVGVQIAQVANQFRVFALKPEARSRLNTVYMIGYFIGGAIGSAAGITAWQTVGWGGVCATGILFSVLAAANHLWGWRAERRKEHLS